MKFDKHKHYSIELERAILGACLLEQSAFGRVYSELETEHFYHTGNQQVFAAMKEIYISGAPIDTLIVADKFHRINDTPMILKESAISFITRLTTEVCGTAHLEYHSFIIRSMWIQREIIRLTHGSVKPEGDIKTQILSLQERLQTIQQKSTKDEWADMTTLMVDLYTHQEDMRRREGIGIACGIKELDQTNGGFHPGQMVVIGARPSVGKSALAGSFALHMATGGKRVGIISLEMSNNEIAARLAAIDTNTDFMVLYRGLYQDEKQTHEVYKRIGGHTSQLPIFVTDKTEVTVIDIKAKAQKLKALHGLDCLIIDYLQLIDTPEAYNRTRENEIARISRHCKIMAKDMNIPVILLCQLNREATRRHGDQRYPQLSDLRESGSIEQDADIVMFLHRDWMVGMSQDEDGNSTENQADLVIRKWRNGKNNFMIKLTFNAGQMKFEPAQTGNWKPLEHDSHYVDN